MPPMMPPKGGRCSDACTGMELEMRADDTVDVIEGRQNDYNQELAPLLEYYREQGNVVDVDIRGGVAVMEPIFAQAFGMPQS